jgi:hypothetical protein
MPAEVLDRLAGLGDFVSFVRGRSGLRFHGVVPAKGEVSEYAVEVMLDGASLLRKTRVASRA